MGMRRTLNWVKKIPQRKLRPKFAVFFALESAQYELRISSLSEEARLPKTYIAYNSSDDGNRRVSATLTRVINSVFSFGTKSRLFIFCKSHDSNKRSYVVNCPQGGTYAGGNRYPEYPGFRGLFPLGVP